MLGEREAMIYIYLDTFYIFLGGSPQTAYICAFHAENLYVFRTGLRASVFSPHDDILSPI